MTIQHTNRDEFEEFYEWLDKCPVQWRRQLDDGDHALYLFIIPNLDDDAGVNHD